MAKFSFSFALLSVCVFCITGTVEPRKPSGRQPRPNPYIEASCKGTRFPDLCVRCLSGFPNSANIQDPQQLAKVALSVGLYRARQTGSFLLDVAKQFQRVKPREEPALNDCLKQINDGVFQLSQSITELRRMETATVSDDVSWHISNVETWTSAALTDASTCLDEFPAGQGTSKLKATIKGKVLNVAQITSNALALFHRYAAKYQSTTKP